MPQGCRLDARVAIGLLITLLTTLDRADADAIVVTRAMLADTVAEIFVTDAAVRVELEIGPNDLPAFADLMPDGVAEKLVPGLPPRSQRLTEFFRDRFVFRADDGDPLPGRVESMWSRKRIIRDEITGEPLAEQPADAPSVVFATLEYPFSGRPKTLLIQPPPQRPSAPAANLGFVVYHQGLPVNDFRYLTFTATLDLNWDDPWYTQFRHRNLRRQNAAPLQAFLYVEPFEVRKEVIVRPKDLQQFVDLGLSDVDTISVDRQVELKDQVARFLGGRCPVSIDGQPAEATLDQIHFVRRSLRRTGIIDPPEPLDLTPATLGVIFVYPIETLPETVSMTWELFDDRIQSVPVAASDEAGPLPGILTPDDPVLRWQNFLTDPKSAEFAAVAPPPASRHVSLPLVTLLCVLALIPVLYLAVRDRQRKGGLARRAWLSALALVAAGAIFFPYARVAIAMPDSAPALPGDQAAPIVRDLLYNVYRSFDRRDPGLIYDRLSRSIGGDLLEQVYLETRKSIEVENQGGMQITVTDVKVEDLQTIGSADSGQAFRCRWTVAGSIGHWGHVHQRVNERSADLVLAVVDDAWKIVGMEINHDAANPDVSVSSPP